MNCFGNYSHRPKSKVILFHHDYSSTSKLRSVLQELSDDKRTRCTKTEDDNISREFRVTSHEVNDSVCEEVTESLIYQVYYESLDLWECSHLKAGLKTAHVNLRNNQISEVRRK